MSKILLIEDDTILLQMYRDKFVHEGFTVETASDGESGIIKMRSMQPDIVLLDLMLPEQSGFDVLKFAKSDPEFAKIPIIILTNAHIEEQDMIKKWSIAPFLTKADYTPDEVVTKVREILL